MATHSIRMRDVAALLALATLLLLLALPACESEGGDTKWERSACTQTIECGPEGRTGWVCAPDGLCYTLAEYCTEDSECRGACVDHVCENGKIVISDGDEDGDEEEPDTECPDTYQCCDDTDCARGSYCNTELHICVLNNTCSEECCSDTDCTNHPGFGAGYICRFNSCVAKDTPCTTDCCKDSDCDPGYVCNLGTCEEQRVTCNAGEKTCCSNRPTLAACLEKEELVSEAVLTCNATGDGYHLTMCPEFQDCIDMGDGTTQCFPNGRCATDADCPCPQICAPGETGLRCQAPSLQLNDTCYGIACEGQTDPASLGRCPDGASCCYDDSVNPTTGTCQNACDR